MKSRKEKNNNNNKKITVCVCVFVRVMSMVLLLLVQQLNVVFTSSLQLIFFLHQRKMNQDDFIRFLCAIKTKRSVAFAHNHSDKRTMNWLQTRPATTIMIIFTANMTIATSEQTSCSRQPGRP